MNALKLLGLALIVAGVLALAYKGFTYTEDTHEAKIGALELSVKEKQRVTIPTWAGIAAVVAGAGCLLASGRR
jgi:multidrug transporter EmrE-like cation transporter